jgi:hypothetical protein
MHLLLLQNLYLFLNLSPPVPLLSCQLLNRINLITHQLNYLVLLLQVSIVLCHHLLHQLLLKLLH